jgi:putative endonuclease
LAYYVYILSNNAGTVLYTGVTGGLQARVFQHKQKLVDGSTKRYNVTRLVYHEKSNEVTACHRTRKADKWRIASQEARSHQFAQSRIARSLRRAVINRDCFAVGSQ